jgi:hypothetical protein
MIEGREDLTVDGDWRLGVPSGLRAFFGARVRIGRGERASWYLVPADTRPDPEVTARRPPPEANAPPDAPPEEVVALDDDGFITIPVALRPGWLSFAELWPLSAWPSEFDRPIGPEELAAIDAAILAATPDASR